MSTAPMLWHSSPIMLGLPSSPLNPNTTHPSSSSPLTSPTPAFQHRPFSFPPITQPFPHNAKASSSKRTHNTRYTRPESDKQRTPPVQADFFAEGTSPITGAMWNEKFARRISDRDRRIRAREDEIGRRRSGSMGQEEGLDDEEADRRAQEDDEEIFRRVVILQRRKAHHAQLVSLETETGGSDPLLPEFWDEDVEPPQPSTVQGSSGQHHVYEDDDMGMTMEESEEERWAREAAEAEEAERWAEEYEVMRQAEERYNQGSGIEGQGESLGKATFDWNGSECEPMELE